MISVIGRRPNFDERWLLALGVQALDDKECAVRDPLREHGLDLCPVRLVRSVELQDLGDWVAYPVFSLGILSPAAFGDAGLDGAEVRHLTPAKASGHCQGVATPM
jgi:hypothetical protein